MGTVVVATFMNLTEAQIAASALESGGLHPLVMDQGWGTVLWIEQIRSPQGFGSPFLRWRSKTRSPTPSTACRSLYLMRYRKLNLQRQGAEIADSTLAVLVTIVLRSHLGG